ncbi:MAG: hypothetical protein M1812_008284, partial [Candelaria pacifica]
FSLSTSASDSQSTSLSLPPVPPAQAFKFREDNLYFSISGPLKSLSQSHNQDDKEDDFSDATEISDHQTNHSAVSEEGEEIDKDAYIQVMKKQVLKMLKEINILKAGKGTTQETTQEVEQEVPHQSSQPQSSPLLSFNQFSDPPTFVSNPSSCEPRGEPIVKFSEEAEDLNQFLEALKMNFLLRLSYYTTDSSKTITTIQALTDNAAT